MLKQTFKKNERLCNRKLIDNLFADGSFFYIYPFKIIWLDTDFQSLVPAQLLISIPKHNIHKAVNRNYMKRVIREAYRKNKSQWCDHLLKTHQKCIFALVFTHKILIPYQQVEATILLILQRLIHEHEKIAK